MTKLFSFTLDLEAEYGGVRDQNNLLRNPQAIIQFLDMLSALDVKITVFTVGSIIGSFPEIIKIFESYDCEFEAHSYSHDLKNADSETEIEKAKLTYFNYFRKNPQGYRAPQGRISNSGIQLLGKHGYLYDSSLFPSYFPNPFRYLFKKRYPHYPKGSHILEIPITSISPLRLTLSVSYLKLFGLSFYIKLSEFFGLPEVICFESHLHDFIVDEDSFEKLPLFWKLIYRRNKFRGIEYTMEFLRYAQNKGYRFSYMSDIYSLYKK
jgi:hypothetical protein